MKISQVKKGMEVFIDKRCKVTDERYQFDEDGEMKKIMGTIQKVGKIELSSYSGKKAVTIKGWLFAPEDLRPIGKIFEGAEKLPFKSKKFLFNIKDLDT